MQLLEEKLAASKLGKVAARRARELVAVPPSLMKDMTAFARDPAAVEVWRNEMADLIEGAK